MEMSSQIKLSEEEANQLIDSLLYKEGTWVNWGLNCQKLQKAGYNSQTIFEQTGFQSIQQNLVIVAAQVYESLLTANVDQEILNYFQGPRSDVLYEFRLLSQEQRAAAAQLAYKKKLDVDGAHQVARAVREVSRISDLPASFTRHPGDAVAHQCWKGARQKKDLQDRSRLIAQGFKFVHSQSAREELEKLLSDFTVVSTVTSPLMPLHRLEAEEELPRIVPVIGTFPLTKEALIKVSALPLEGPFGVAHFLGGGAFVALPGWQSVLKAQAPVAIFCLSDQLPKPLPGKAELVLVLVDRLINQWDINSYFLVEKEGKLEFKWFEESPNLEILGQVVLVLRPKNIFDENILTEPWQMDD
jgi:hypothetical protein